MKKLYILIFTLLLFTGVTLGQTVKGHVYDAETHERYRASTSPTKK